MARENANGPKGNPPADHSSRSALAPCRRDRRGAPFLAGVALAASLTLLAAAACGGEAAPRSPRARPSYSPSAAATASEYRPRIDPKEFVQSIDNPLFPLEPGTVFRLRGATEDGIQHETITVTNGTKKIMGVQTTVVRDEVRSGGDTAELTYDWYAQDRHGNVWYFGEDTAEYEDGKVVSREGSWQAGVDGAQPGIVMTARPRVTDSYRQEYYRGEAEDMFWVVATGGSVRVPFGALDGAVRTVEWTPLEPDVVVEKFYAPGVGLIAERALSGPREIVQLVDVTRPQEAT